MKSLSLNLFFLSRGVRFPVLSRALPELEHPQNKKREPQTRQLMLFGSRAFPGHCRMPNPHEMTSLSLKLVIWGGGGGGPTPPCPGGDPPPQEKMGV